MVSRRNEAKPAKLPSFIYYPATRNFSIRKSPITSIILHSTDGASKEGDLTWLSGEAEGSKVSCHWYITRAGVIYMIVPDYLAAWHVGKVRLKIYDNQHSVGIEMQHKDGQEDWPPLQVDACARVCAYYRKKLGPDIPIVGHAAVAIPAGRKVDPMFFPWHLLSQLVQNHVMMKD